MTSESIDWDEDLPADPEEEYQTFVRTLERTEGFRLLFVQCSLAGGKQLIAKVKKDIPQKTIEVLRLEQPIDNLYDIVNRLPNREKINILFIQGLEHSFYEYELLRFRDTSERYFYSWEGVPKILNHLNQQRERFRDDFNIFFIFLLRPFALKYFIHRAQDFFDWRSSVFEFPTSLELVEQESSRILRRQDEGNYHSLTLGERIQEVLNIQELLEEKHQTNPYRDSLMSCIPSLLWEAGMLYAFAKEYGVTISDFVQAFFFEVGLEFKPDNDWAWNNRGIALETLGRTKEAIASYEKAIFFKPDNYSAWNNRGVALKKLGRLEEALASYEKALEFNLDKDEAWNNRGIALDELGRTEEAITSYNKALQFKSDNDSALYNRGNALKKLGRTEEAIASYNKALQFKPSDYEVWYNLGNALADLGQSEQAIASYDKALEFKPNYYEAWYNRGIVLDELGRFEEAIASYDKTIAFNPKDDAAWYNRAMALAELGRSDEAIASYDKVLEFNPDDDATWHNRGIVLDELGRFEEAIASYDKALEFNPDFYEA